jgi:hypothetical protein
MGKLRELMEDDIAAGRVADHSQVSVDDDLVASAAKDALQATAGG